MKLKDVEVGGRYVAKVSGKHQVVRITAKREVFSGRQMRWVFDAVNEATATSGLFRMRDLQSTITRRLHVRRPDQTVLDGRRITIRSPQRLRRRAEG